ncbi:MAG TPA: hypothetical protein DEO38_05935 [Bacteroidales bacterium]|nr:hypothetical protein [Bacteroidales bacterium]
MNKKIKILLLHNAETMALFSTLERELTSMGYDVFSTPDATTALSRYKRVKHHLVITDINSNATNTKEFYQNVLDTNHNANIVVISYQHSKEDITEALAAGVIDFIKAELDPHEIVLRLGKLMLYCGIIPYAPETHINIGRYVLEINKQTLTDTETGTETILTGRECQLLKILRTYSGQIVEREWVLRTFWNNDANYNARSMDVYVSRLRKLLSGDSTIKITSKRGKGYMLTIA